MSRNSATKRLFQLASVAALVVGSSITSGAQATPMDFGPTGNFISASIPCTANIFTGCAPISGSNIGISANHIVPEPFSPQPSFPGLSGGSFTWGQASGSPGSVSMTLGGFNGTNFNVLTQDPSAFLASFNGGNSVMGTVNFTQVQNANTEAPTLIGGYSNGRIGQPSICEQLRRCWRYGHF